MDFRELSGDFSVVLLFGVICTGTCGNQLNHVGDGLQPAQSLGATVLGYARFTQCDEVKDVNYNEGYYWDCNFWSPERIVVRPYRSWLVAPKVIAPLLRYDYVLAELVLALILLIIGVTQKDPYYQYRYWK